MDRVSVGKAGERAAVDLLKKQGYRILGRNIRCPRGEIDIVARHRDTICFVEVRTRRAGGSHALARESVGLQKRRRLAYLAVDYLRGRGWSDRRARFDVVSVVLREGRPEAALIQNVFSLEEVLLDP